MLVTAATHIHRTNGSRVAGGEPEAQGSRPVEFGAKHNNRRPVPEVALEKLEMPLEDFGLRGLWHETGLAKCQLKRRVCIFAEGGRAAKGRQKGGKVAIRDDTDHAQ
jgi:hypothetical protein